MRPFVPACLCLAAGLLLLLALQFWPRPGQPVAILFRPGTAPEQALMLTGAAGHRPMRLLRAVPPLVLAAPEEGFHLPHEAVIFFATSGVADCFQQSQPSGISPWI